MQRYKLTIEYDGTPYAGWQRQENASSVQQEIEQAASQFAQHEVKLQCAGRTDAGVHALGQVAHMDLEKHFDCYSVMHGIHHYLKKQPISIVKLEEAAEDFHARFNATSRRYQYHIINRPSRLTLDRKRAWHIHRPMDIDAMREAAKLLVGKHDFSSFRAAACQADSPIKTLDRLEVEQNGEHIFIHAQARSFLHHQVRNIAGALGYVGKGKWSVADVQTALDAKDRNEGPYSAPAHGLYFMEVYYEK